MLFNVTQMNQEIWHWFISFLSTLLFGVYSQRIRQNSFLVKGNRYFANWKAILNNERVSLLQVFLTNWECHNLMRHVLVPKVTTD